MIENLKNRIRTTTGHGLGTFAKVAALALVLMTAMPNSADAVIFTVCQNDFACGGPGSCTGGTVCARDIDRRIPGCCTVLEAYCAPDCFTPESWFNLCPTGFCRGSFASTSEGQELFDPFPEGGLTGLGKDGACPVIEPENAETAIATSEGGEPTMDNPDSEASRATTEAPLTEAQGAAGE